ncbi:MAG TPA: transcriptional repressor [Chloroflexota bacterium]|nr:transcriptional repressor [Chloroflexota bacterium]
MTAGRLVTLEVLTGVNRHLDAAAVAAAVQERLGQQSIQAIYNNLHLLTDAGMLRRIELPGHPAQYELRVGDNHHHLVCRRCGAIADVDCAVGDTPCLTAADDSGYEIDEAEVIYWGRCPACVAATAVSSGELKRTRSVRHRLGDTPSDPEQPGSSAMSHQQETPREENDRRV